MSDKYEVIFEPELFSPDLSDDLLIPFGAALRGGTLTYTYPSEFEPLAKLAAGLGDPFDESVRDGIIGIFDPRGRDKGFRTEITSTIVFCVPAEYEPDISLIRSDTFLVDRKMLKKLKKDIEDEPEPPFFGTVRHGRLVSAAYVNSYPADGGLEYDIGVETFFEYENLGCATSNVISLCRDAAEKNKFLTYIAETDDCASIRVAEKAGLMPLAKEMRVIWFR
ncbi:MAG: hypothetical protein J5830_05425 [Clostridia bacterium]|nr:hypothetical protein [Clostridia bacterium]